MRNVRVQKSPHRKPRIYQDTLSLSFGRVKVSTSLSLAPTLDTHAIYFFNYHA